MINKRFQWPGTRLQHVIYLTSVALTLLLSLGGMVLASANYITTVQFSNNGTAETEVWGTFALSTQGMIDGDLLNASANNSALQTNAGTKVAFMPSANTTYPWCAEIPSIGASSDVKLYLYSDDVTDGKIRYFPGAAGLTVPDTSWTTLDDTFSFEWDGYLDAASGSDKELVNKDGAFRTYIGASGNVTAAIQGLGATYPTVAATTGGNNTTDNTSHTVNLPTGITSGDLLIVLFSSDASSATTITFPAGWTQLYQDDSASGNRGGAWYRVADGTETSTITSTTSSAQMTSHTSYRITGYSGTPTSGTSAAGDGSGNPAIPACTPSWGSAANLWIATAHINGQDPVIALGGYPTNFTDLISNLANDPGGTATGSAVRNYTGTTLDPDIFYTAGTGGWVSNLIAVAPDFADSAVSASITGVTTGEHTITARADGYFMGVGADLSATTSYPASGNLSLNLPLYHADLNGSSFLSKDVNTLTCTVTGATWGNTGRGFDSIDDKIDCTNAAIFTLGTGDFSVSFWVYRDSITTGAAVLGTGTGKKAVVLTSDGGLLIGLEGATPFATNANLITGGSWVYVTVVRSGNNCLIYRNGFLWQTITNGFLGGNNTTSENLLIGQ